MNAHNRTRWGAVLAATILMTLSAPGTLPAQQTFTTLANLNGTDGAEPEFMSLVQGADGNLYGTTSNGGLLGNESCGTVFRLTPSAAFTTLYNFGCQADGGYPHGGLVLGTDGKLYGTTSQYGTRGSGTVFKITTAGSLSALFSFGDFQGFLANGALIQATDGNFYGETAGGGHGGNGVIYQITAAGGYHSLYRFCPQFGCLDGSGPYGPLVQGPDGNLYGTTLAGGANHPSREIGYGTVFNITPTGTLTTIHSFNVTDGQNPQAGLVLGEDGNFYGTTLAGGAFGAGTVFKITPSGTLTTLHSFEGTDGADPAAPLIQATDGNFYGTTSRGGDNSCQDGCGTIFTMSLSGVFTTLYNFISTGGFYPADGLLQATNGVFYGATTAGGGSSSCFLGAIGCGTIYSLSVGLRPFVETVPRSGGVGTVVKILGNRLTGATGVTFNAVPAKFTVISSTLISTEVPAGATSGSVEVTTPTSTLKSNVKFQIM